MPAKKRSTSKAASKSAAKKVNRNVELKKIFDEIDNDGSGAIDETELLNNAGLLGFGKLTQFEIGKLLDEADTDGDGEMDFAEFVAVVEKARYTDSKWKNAGVLANGVKRYNNLLSASDHIFGTIQAAVSASSETSEDGIVKAGASQIVGNIINTIFVTAGIYAGSAVASHLIEKKITEIGFFGAVAGGLENIPNTIGLCMLVGALIPWVIAWTRSQPHIGGLIMGHEVLDFKTKNKASLGQMFLRTLISTFNLIGACYIICQLGATEMNTTTKWQEDCAMLDMAAIAMGFIEFILILSKSDSRGLIDTLVGTQIAVRK